MKRFLLASLLTASCALFAQNQVCTSLGSITKSIFLTQYLANQASVSDPLLFELGGQYQTGTTIKKAMDALGSTHSTSLLTDLKKNGKGQTSNDHPKYKDVRTKVASDCITGLTGKAVAVLGTTCGRSSCYLRNFVSGPGENFQNAAGVNVDKVNSKFFIFLDTEKQKYYCGIMLSDIVEAITDPVAVSTSSWQGIWSGNNRDYVRELNNGRLYTRSGNFDLPLKVYVRMSDSSAKTADILTASNNNSLFNKKVPAGSYGVATTSDRNYGCLYLVQERKRNTADGSYSLAKIGLEFVAISGANASCPSMQDIRDGAATFIGLPGLAKGDDYAVRARTQMSSGDVVRGVTQVCTSGTSSI